MLFLSSFTSTGSWSTFTMIAQLFFILIVFIGVALAAIFLTRTINSSRYGKNAGENLRIIDSLGLGFQSGIHLVKAGGKYILLGITKDKITFLCEIDEYDDKEMANTDNPQYSFENYLSHILGKRKDKNDN